NAGTITATATFGTPPYEYQFLSYETGDDAPPATDLGWISDDVFNGDAGNYIVYVKDTNNCIVFKEAKINLDPSPEISLSVPNQCTATPGSFSVDVELTTAGV